ncbi:MAG: choice-of-anchor D domain-containing protein [Myxococcales bacterium]
MAGAVVSTFSGCSCDESPHTRQAGPQIEVRLLEPGGPVDEGTSLAHEATIDFGIVKLGGATTRSLAVRNFGDADLTAETPFFEKGTAFQLTTVMENCGEATDDLSRVPFGGCRLIVVEFHPEALGEATDVLVLRSDDKERPELKLRLRGRAAVGALQVCVASVVGSDQNEPLDQCSSADKKELTVNFGSLPFDGGSLERAVRLRNLGDVDLVIEGVTPAAGDPVDFALEPAGYQAVLAPGESAFLALVFKPSDVGQRSGTLTVSADDPAGAPVLIHLTARGDATRLCLEPKSVDFGNIDMGTVSPAKQVLLRNCGTRELEIAEAALERDPDFRIVQPLAANKLRPGEGAPVAIVLEPTSIGAKIGRLKVSSTDPVAPVQLAVLTGNAVPPQVCRLEASSAILDFGAQVQGTQTLKSVTLHNAGNSACTLGSPSIDAAGQAARFLIATMPPVATLGPNGLLDVTIAYNPQDATGPDQGVFELPADDPTLPGGRLRIALRGTPTAQPQCTLVVNPPRGAGGRTMNFGVVGLGERKTLLMTLENVGSKFCDIGAPRKGMLTESAFSFGTHSPPLPGRIDPGQTAVVEVVFQPRTEGEFLPMMNSFTISTSDGAPSECTGLSGAGPGCKQVSLRGTGVVLAIDAVPRAVDFGVVTVGCNSADRTVTVYNIGGAAVTISGFEIDPPASSFTLVSHATTPITLQPGRSTAVVLRYRPRGTGLESANLVIAHSFSGGTTTVPLKGTGSTATHQRDFFSQNSVPKTDVLWVIDNSGSMYDKQQFLAANATEFINQANALNSDYQVAVIATEWAGSNPPHQADNASAFPGTPINAGEFFGNPKIIKRSDPDPAAELSRNIRVGECCSDPAESGLEAAKAALSDPLISDPAKPNSQFVREDAKLAIIVLSDEEDQGASQNVEYYVDFFQTLKGAKNTSLFAWHSIVGDSPSGCSATVNGHSVQAAAGKRYIEASTRTNGIFRSICTSDWGRIANDIGLDAFAAKTQFFLSRTADPATLVVTVNGAPQTAGVDFDFDASANSIDFKAGHVPPAGASITAEYDTLCL